MDIDAYLARIGAKKPRLPDAGALAELQIAHLLTVPFENLDIVAGRPISLDLDAIFDKIVRRRRGGFCYELNGLFAWLLEGLGYRVTMLSGRTIDGVHGMVGPEYDHLALRVDLEEPWLTDVGFGDTFRTPMPLVANSELTDPLGRGYRLEVTGEEWDVRERLEPGAEAFDAVEHLGAEASWRTQFRFTLRPCAFAEFEPTCRWQETESPYFTQHRLCTIATPDGRRTLMDDRLIERSVGKRTERRVDEDEVPGLLWSLFGVQLKL